MQSFACNICILLSTECHRENSTLEDKTKKSQENNKKQNKTICSLWKNPKQILVKMVKYDGAAP